MAHRVHFNASDFEFIKTTLLSWGFRPIYRTEINSVINRLQLTTERKRKTDPEEGFVFSAIGLNVYVWTSFSRFTHEAQDHDQVWVLITQGDDAVYFAKPMRRTADMIPKLLQRAAITQYKVINRPHCKKCQRAMDIFRKNTGACFWACFNKTVHTNPVFTKWDENVPAEDQQFLDRMRAVTAAYKKKDKQAGIVRTPARMRRKKWKTNLPQNKITIIPRP